MKQKDIALIIFVTAMSGMVALVVSNFFISSSDNRQEKVEVVEAITDDFQAPPDARYFNSNSINPTQIIRIGDEANPDPFAGN